MGHCVCCEPCFTFHDTTPTCSPTSGEIHHSLHQRHHTFWVFLWTIDWLKLFGFSAANWGGWCKWMEIYKNIYFHNQQHSYYLVHKEANMYCIIFYKIEIPCTSWGNQRNNIHIKHLYQELKILKIKLVDLHCDNHSTIKISHDFVYHTKTKHFEIHQHFVKNMVERKEKIISYVSTDNQPTNILTKALRKTKFENCVKLFNAYAILKSQNLNVWYLGSLLPLL
jgi:hypothetical protein